MRFATWLMFVVLATGLAQANTSVASDPSFRLSVADDGHLVVAEQPASLDWPVHSKPDEFWTNSDIVDADDSSIWCDVRLSVSKSAKPPSFEFQVTRVHAKRDKRNGWSPLTGRRRAEFAYWKLSISQYPGQFAVAVRGDSRATDESRSKTIYTSPDWKSFTEEHAGIWHDVVLPKLKLCGLEDLFPEVTKPAVTADDNRTEYAMAREALLTSDMAIINLPLSVVDDDGHLRFDHHALRAATTRVPDDFHPELNTWLRAILFCVDKDAVVSDSNVHQGAIAQVTFKSDVASGYIAVSTDNTPFGPKSIAINLEVPSGDGRNIQLRVKSLDTGESIKVLDVECSSTYQKAFHSLTFQQSDNRRNNDITCAYAIDNTDVRQMRSSTWGEFVSSDDGFLVEDVVPILSQFGIALPSTPATETTESDQ